MAVSIGHINLGTQMQDDSLNAGRVVVRLWLLFFIGYGKAKY